MRPRTLPRLALRVTTLLPPLGALAAAGQAFAQGCAMCGSALGDDPLGRAISWSVIFMMATPYMVVGSVGGWILYKHWRARPERGAVIALTRAATRRAIPADAGGELP